MKIDLNKDFENQYKNEFLKGFTLRETLYGGLAFCVAAMVGILIWWNTGIAINICIYLGIPFMIPIVAMGMIKHQGHSWSEMWKEIYFFVQTKELSVQMEERKNVNVRIFTMDKTKMMKEKRERRKR